MSLISFLKDAGEKLMHHGAGAGGTPPVAQAQTDAGMDAGTDAGTYENGGAASATGNGASDGLRSKEQALERAILDYMSAQNLPIEEVTVRYESASATVHVTGSVPDQQTREKMILCCGNVQGVEHVDDGLSVAQSDSTESQYYTVESGDSLSKIAQKFYGDAGQYQAIFEANQPMLSDPNRIYPGQTLRIPAA